MIRLALAFLMCCLTLGAMPVQAQETEDPYTFVSMPDFLNTDVGNLRHLRRWERGDHNSINRSYRRAMDVVLDSIEAEAPDSVLVAGDLVNGHWGTDTDHTRIFGRTNTFKRKLNALRRAGNLYYNQWADRFEQRDLPVYAAVGDHEIGNDQWRPGTFKYSAFPRFKQVWAKHFTDSGTAYDSRPVNTRWSETAYAEYLSPDVLLVTVDVFKRMADGVHPTVADGQLQWLDALLAHNTSLGDSGAKWVIVQGHTPVLGPVRYANSSRLMLEGGAESPFWQTLKAHDVDLYLSGEVHEFTATDDGVMQVAHGAYLPVGAAGYNYLVGKVYGDRIELEVKRIERTSGTVGREMWQLTNGRPPVRVTYKRGSYLSGTALLTKDASTLEGEFQPYVE